MLEFARLLLCVRIYGHNMEEKILFYEFLRIDLIYFE